jgi:hypothetical protein
VEQRRKDIAMSVATQLGLSDPTQELLALAREAWPQWQAAYPTLGVVEDLLDLPAWIRAAEREEADDVLHVLAELGSPSGGDDVTAAGALAWLLLPGACVVAHRLRALTSRIDEVVAAQLWLEVRGFPWERQRKVAANITMNTRRGVLRDLGIGQDARYADPTWARSIPLGPDSELWTVMDAKRLPSSATAETELAEVLVWALAQGVIDERDRDLLVTLAVAADQAGVRHSGRGRGGLTSHLVTTAVATEAGVSPITIRRRATASLKALAAAAGQISA